VTRVLWQKVSINELKQRYKAWGKTKRVRTGRFATWGRRYSDSKRRYRGCRRTIKGEGGDVLREGTPLKGTEPLSLERKNHPHEKS